MNYQQRKEIKKLMAELTSIKQKIKNIYRKEWKKAMAAEDKLARFASGEEIDKAEAIREFPEKLDDAVFNIEEGIDVLKQCVRAG